MRRFDRAAAAAYAIKWAKHRNPAFPDFSGNRGGGGDCTNFVSQCMLAGGWPMIAPTWRDMLDWECTGTSHNDATRSWKVVRSFAQFIKLSRRASKCERKDLDVGDLVMLEDHDIKYHFMIISRKEPGPKGPQVRFCGHTNERLDEKLDDHVPPDSKIAVYWKVADFF